MQSEKIARDEIIEEVERVREEIARRYDFDVDRIFEAVKERSAMREKEQKASEQAAQGSA
jgi:hypothetical protein